MSLTIRKLISQDCRIITGAFTQQGWDKPVEKYRHYLDEAAKKFREVLIAEVDGEFAGYLNIVWTSEHPPFRDRSVPEITDLNVLIKFQKRGFATGLLEDAELLIGERSEIAGIRVGLIADYGSAQRLYVQRGYVPDGYGLFHGSQSLRYGDNVTVDDDLTLGFMKRVGG